MHGRFNRTTEGAPEAETAKVTDVPQACQDFLDKYPDPAGKIAAVALYDTAGAHGYQRRERKIATFPF